MILAPTMQQRWGGRAFLLELGEFPCYQIRGEFHIWFWVVEMEKKNSTSLFENSSSCHCPNWGHARWRGEWGWSRGKMEKQVQQMNNIQQCCHKDFSLGQQLQKYLKIIELIYSFVLCQHSKSVFCITYYCWELQNMRSRNVSANVENQWCDICNNKTDCLKRSISTCFLVIQNISFVCRHYYSGMGEELFMMIDCVKLPPVF